MMTSWSVDIRQMHLLTISLNYIRDRMKRRVWTTALGILNIVSSALIILFYCIWVLEFATGIFAFLFPVVLAAIVPLVCSIVTLKRRRWEWSIVGLIVSGMVGAYLFILSRMIELVTAE
jgi:hypothetical protein